MPIHLSVQANAVNWATVKFWHQMGLTRAILSRELSLDEIEEIRMQVRRWSWKSSSTVPSAWPTPGRCLLSGYINKRDPNQGTCTNSCRWEYKVHEGKEDDVGQIVHRQEPIAVRPDNTLGLGQAERCAGAAGSKVQPSR
ncbi:U32 family peptidase [Escherichia coli]